MDHILSRMGWWNRKFKVKTIKLPKMKKKNENVFIFTKLSVYFYKSIFTFFNKLRKSYVT